MINKTLPLNHEMTPKPIIKRPRRNRKSFAIRSLVQETRLHPSNFVAPLFIMEGIGQKISVPSMPGVHRLSIDLILKEVENLYEKGVLAVDLFAVIPPEKRNAQASEAYSENNLLQRAVIAIKKELPEMCVMVDVALDPFTDHGHDGLVDENGIILNDPTLESLLKMTLLLSESGADIIAPSDMMDGRVGFLRDGLDNKGFLDVGILAYTAKYASSFYGPFRDALNTKLQFGDKKTYQMNPANSREAILEASLDENEGADMLLVKPALPYLDILSKIKERTHLPVGAYQVSGEYSMILAAGQKGWIDSQKVMKESLLSIKRAGADFILTYAANEMADLLNLE